MLVDYSSTAQLARVAGHHVAARYLTILCFSVNQTRPTFFSLPVEIPTHALSTDVMNLNFCSEVTVNLRDALPYLPLQHWENRREHVLCRVVQDFERTNNVSSLL